MSQTETITLRLVAQDFASGNISKAIGGIDRMAQRGGIAGSAMQGIGLSFGMMLNPMNLALTGMSAVSDAFSGAVRNAGDFDKAMTESLAIMSDVSDVMRDDMERAAKDVAKTTTFSAKQAAEAYFYLASAGLDATQSIKAMPQVAQFAQAGMFDLAQATDLLTDAQSALGLSVDDATENMENMVHVSDVLVKANALSNASVEQFSTALTSKAGAALKAFGIDLEEGVAVLAAFADQGVKAEEAGNALDRILRLLPDAALKNADAFKELGIAVFDSEGEMRNLGDIVADLEGALAGMSDRQKQAALTALGFQARVQGIIKPLLGTSKQIKVYEQELRKAGGTTKSVADKQLDTFNEKLGILQDTMEVFSTDIGMLLIDPLTDFVDFLNSDAIPGVERFADELLNSRTERQARDFDRAFRGMADSLGLTAEEAATVAQRSAMLVGQAIKDGKLYSDNSDAYFAAVEGIAKSVAVSLGFVTEETLKLGEAGAASSDGITDSAQALRDFKNSLDDFDDVRSIENVEKAIGRQEKAIRRAMKEDNAASWARHKAKLQELKDELATSQAAEDAFNEAKEQNDQRRRMIARIARQAGVSEKKVREELQKTSGDVDKVKRKLGIVQDTLEDVGNTKAVPKIGMDLSEWNRRMAEWRIDMAEINAAAGITYDPLTGSTRKSTLRNIPPTAEGGIVTKPQVRLVGEAGPEAIIPLDRAGVGGVSVNIYGGNWLGEPEEFAKRLMPLVERERRKARIG